MIAALQDDRYYRWCTYLFVPLQYAGLVFAAWCWAHAPMATGEKIALAMTVGVVAGVGINAAHELGHKSSRLERRLAKIVLAQSFYGHFYIEHNHGHHVNVATPRDPASARFGGESFWIFLPPQRIRRSEIGLADRISTPAPAGFTRTVASKQHLAGMVAERRTVRDVDHLIRVADTALAAPASLGRDHVPRGRKLPRTLRIAPCAKTRRQLCQSPARRQLEQ